MVKLTNCPKCNAPRTFAGDILVSFMCFSSQITYPGREKQFQQSWECVEKQRDLLLVECERYRAAFHPWCERCRTWHKDGDHLPPIEDEPALEVRDATEVGE